MPKAINCDFHYNFESESIAYLSEVKWKILFIKEK